MLQNKLTLLRDALVGISSEVKVYHYWRPKMQAPFIVWQEDGEADSLSANNRKAEQSIEGAVDFYTKTEYDPVFDQIQEVLNDLENYSFNYDGTMYEDETGLIHHSWTWRLFYGVP